MHTSKLVLVSSQGSLDESDFFYHKFSIIDFFSMISLVFLHHMTSILNDVTQTSKLW